MRLHLRLLILALSLFSFFCLLIGQYFRLQILQGSNWSKRARAQHEILVKEPFRRGSFFANTTLHKGMSEKSRPFVFDVAKFHLYMDPLAIEESFLQKIAKHLSTILDFPEEKIQQALKKKTHYQKIALWLEGAQKEQVLQWWRPFAKENKLPQNAIFFVSDYKRSYPYGALLGQVLHTIRELKDETTKEGIPTGGLEAYFNEQLKGKHGLRKLLRSPLNRLDLDELIQPCEHGADIYLTIDATIQSIMEEELEQGVKQVQSSGGWAMMMDPHTGQILGLAQYPFFDPGEYRHFFNDPSKMNHSKVRAVTDAFELGSIMKPITVAIGLLANEQQESDKQKKIFDPEEAINVTRTLFPGRKSKPMKDTTPSIALNLNMAIQKSSNIYMAEIVDRVVEKLGVEWYRNQLVQRFGFGSRSGIELPAEAMGFVPRFNHLHVNGTLEWSKSTPYSLAIGYNMLATPVQMLRAFAIFANGGYLVKPTLVRKIVKGGENGKEEVLLDNSADYCSLEKKRVLSPSIAKTVRNSLKFTTKPGGTGALAEIYGYTEGGKTGTAEKIIDGHYCKDRHLSSFVGFAPLNSEDPLQTRFVLIVTIDDPQSGILENGVKSYMAGRCAAPLFERIAKRTLVYMGVPQDDPHGFPTKDPRYDSECADWSKEVKELKSLYERWNKK